MTHITTSCAYHRASSHTACKKCPFETSIQFDATTVVWVRLRCHMGSHVITRVGSGQSWCSSHTTNLGSGRDLFRVLKRVIIAAALGYNGAIGLTMFQTSVYAVV
jgi:hypothetical protein